MARLLEYAKWRQSLNVSRWGVVGLLLLGLLVLGIIRTYPVHGIDPSLPRVTRTSRGVAGDPINLMMVGSGFQIQESFRRAGWLVPDPVTPATSARIAVDSITGRTYPTAPVSNLYVFGRSQDYAFELPTNNVQNRGHVRLWQTGIRVEGQSMWIGQASYDQGIELSGSNGLPTHHIAPAVDIERDTVGADLLRSGLASAVTREPYAMPIFAAHNGGGDYYASDGQVLVVWFAPSRPSFSGPTGFAAIMANMTHELFHAYSVVLLSPVLAVALAASAAILIVFAGWPGIVLLWRSTLGATK